MNAARKPHILVVDDEPQVLAAVEDQLEDLYVVHAVTSGRAALSLLDELKDVSVILSDQRMPGMAGDELFARAAVVSDAARVLITGFADLEAVIRAVNRGKVFGYLTKPWDQAELRMMIHRADEHHTLVRELQHERNLLRNLMDSVPDEIKFKDLEHRYLRINRQAARDLGLAEPAAAFGKHDHELGLGEELAAARRQRETAVIQSGQVEQADERRDSPTGAPAWFSRTIAPVRDDAGRVVSIVSIARDITARKAMEVQLQEREAALRHAQHMAGIGHVVIDAEGNVIGASESLSDLLGLEPDALPRNLAGFLDIVHPEDRALLIESVQRAKVAGGSYEIEYRIIRRNGEIAHIRQAGEQISGTMRGHAGSRFATLQDVTALRRREIESRLLFELSSAMAEEADLASALTKAIELVCRRTGWEYGEIWFESEPEKFSLAAQWHTGGASMQQFAEASADVAILLGEGLVGTVMQTREPRWLSGMANPGGLFLRHAAAERAGLKTGVAVPLMTPEISCTGVLALYTGLAIRLDDPVLELMRAVARQLAIAIERKRDAEQITRLTRMQGVLSGINSTIVRVTSEDELFEAACRLIVETGGMACGQILLAASEGTRLVPAAAHGPVRFHSTAVDVRRDTAADEPPAIIAFRDCRIHVQEVDESACVPQPGPAGGTRTRLGAVACIPLTVKDQALGVILVGAENVDVFDEAECRLLQELAGDVAFAIDTLRNRKELYYLALHDPLTGLANRSMFRELIAGRIAANEESGDRFAVVVANLRRFRNVNETLGIHVGDELLRQAGQRLARTAGKERVARLSADLFGVLLDVVRSTDQAIPLVARLGRSLAPAFEIDGKEVHMDAHFGIAMYPGDGATADSLAANAEAALQKGRSLEDTLMFYRPEINARVAERLDVENRLRRALEEGQFLLHYQPKVDARDGTIIGAEALLRWNDPGSGLVAPGRFIPVLEDTGMIVDVGGWVIAEAARAYGRLRAAGLDCPRIAVNVSQVQMRRRDFAREVLDAIGGDRAGSHGVDLEITESMLVENFDHVVKQLEVLRESGFKLAVDDFGTGYSSLAWLARLPIDALKIDRSFILRMADDANSMTIVSTIINLAHSFKLQVVAEGVETDEQLKLLRLLRCDAIQGYLFHKPLPEADLLGLLQERAGMG